jgi:hypothetical protein
MGSERSDYLCCVVDQTGPASFLSLTHDQATLTPCLLFGITFSWYFLPLWCLYLQLIKTADLMLNLA